MTDETTNPEHEGAIEFKRGHFLCKLVTWPYAELAAETDANARDITLALQANPQLRAAVLPQIPEFSELCQREDEWRRKVGEAQDGAATEARRCDELLTERNRARNETLAALERVEKAESKLAAERARVRELEEWLTWAKRRRFAAADIDGKGMTWRVQSHHWESLDALLCSSKQPAPPPAEQAKGSGPAICGNCDAHAVDCRQWQKEQKKCCPDCTHEPEPTDATQRAGKP